MRKIVRLPWAKRGPLLRVTQSRQPALAAPAVSSALLSLEPIFVVQRFPSPGSDGCPGTTVPPFKWRIYSYSTAAMNSNSAAPE